MLLILEISCRFLHFMQYVQKLIEAENMAEEYELAQFNHVILYKTLNIK